MKCQILILLLFIGLKKLAKPTKEIQVIFKRFENMKFTCEYKYDGLRGQVHFNKGKCSIFSRNLINMTESYPDIADFIEQHIPAHITDFIMDSEIVAIDKNSVIITIIIFKIQFIFFYSNTKGRILPF